MAQLKAALSIAAWQASARHRHGIKKRSISSHGINKQQRQAWRSKISISRRRQRKRKSINVVS